MINLLIAVPAALLLIVFLFLGGAFIGMMLSFVLMGNDWWKQMADKPLPTAGLVILLGCMLNGGGFSLLMLFDQSVTTAVLQITACPVIAGIATFMFVAWALNIPLATPPSNNP